MIEQFPKALIQWEPKTSQSRDQSCGSRDLSYLKLQRTTTSRTKGRPKKELKRRIAIDFYAFYSGDEES